MSCALTSEEREAARRLWNDFQHANIEVALENLKSAPERVQEAVLKALDSAIGQKSTGENPFA